MVCVLSGADFPFVAGLLQVLLMERMYMRREMYLSIMMDRGSQVSFPLSRATLCTVVKEGGGEADSGSAWGDTTSEGTKDTHTSYLACIWPCALLASCSSLLAQLSVTVRSKKASGILVCWLRCSAPLILQRKVFSAACWMLQRPQYSTVVANINNVSLHQMGPGGTVESFLDERARSLEGGYPCVSRLDFHSCDPIVRGAIVFFEAGAGVVASKCKPVISRNPHLLLSCCFLCGV